MTPEQMEEIVNRMAQQLHEHEQFLQPARQAPLLNHKEADARYSPAVMRVHLGSGGSAPLSIDGLHGATAAPQHANIPEVPQLPELGDPKVQTGTVLVHQGVVYRRGDTAWNPIAGGKS